MEKATVAGLQSSFHLLVFLKKIFCLFMIERESMSGVEGQGSKGRGRSRLPAEQGA